METKNINIEFIDQVVNATTDSIKIYCETVIDKNTNECKIEEFLNCLNLHGEISNSNSLDEILISFTDYFNFMYLNLFWVINQEEYETAELIRRAIKIEKTICLNTTKNFGKQVEKDVKIIEQKIKDYYKI